MRPALPVVVLSAALAGFSCTREEAANPPDAQPRSQTPSPSPSQPVVPTEIPATYKDGGFSVSLPKQVGAWSRPDTPRHVTATNIFDYMDGAGELYLAYRFDKAEVFEYAAADASLGSILVELYRMRTSEDAFGLLSNDWGGEPVFGAAAKPAGETAVPPHRALYGAGLLRIWAGPLYVRVLAARETTASREAVLRIGEALARSAPSPDAVPPAVAAGLPAQAEARAVRADRTCFFRSHLVLNSAFFLASQDILGLGLDVDAVTTEYRPAAGGGRPIRVIAVRYPSAQRATAGLTAFGKAYLPEAVRGGTLAASGAAAVEDGWVGWAARGQQVSIALGAPDAAAARGMAMSIAGAAPGGAR